MKKYVFIFLILSSIKNADCQDNLGALRFGHELFVSTNGGGINNYFGGGISYQRAVTEKIAIGLNVDYMAGGNSYFLFNLEPRFDYFIEKVFSGFHIGSHMAYNVAGLSGGFATNKTLKTGLVNPSSNGFNLGINAGYMIKIGEVRLDIAISPSYWLNMTNTGDDGITMKTMATLGYAF